MIEHDNAPDPLASATEAYELSDLEKLALLFATLPVEVGVPSVDAATVDVDRYAREIVARRDLPRTIEAVRGDVAELLAKDKSGHGIEHVDRVTALALGFARYEQADTSVVELTSLLHDVDDYKLFGAENAEHLTNARAILERHRIHESIGRKVLENISLMGYSKYLEGIRPKTLEGAVVSDADMCDAIGAQGIIRVFEYNASKDRPFFAKTIPPVSSELSTSEYRAAGNEHAVQHFFDKLLLIPDILMTHSGRKEGERRAKIMTSFLGELFREEDAQDWQRHLDDFLNQKG